MVTVAPLAAPEQGQIVTVRQRRYVVTDVLPSALPAPQPGSLAAQQHFVVWEAAMGARISQRTKLSGSAGFDSFGRLGAFLLSGPHTPRQAIDQLALHSSPIHD